MQHILSFKTTQKSKNSTNEIYTIDLDQDYINNILFYDIDMDDYSSQSFKSE